MYIKVKDTGLGIPDEEVPRLFREFSKVKDEENLNPNGVGLGLFICKSVVESCGGNIWIESSTLKARNS